MPPAPHDDAPSHEGLKMNTPSLAKTLLFLCVLAISPWVTYASADSARPNILLIMADDLGYNDVGFNGSTEIPTPHLDRLAAAGTIFSSAYVAHPFCGPSRAALMTGRAPHDIGSQFNLPENGAGPDEGIDVNETMISKVLQNAGYHTGLIGKWHLGESAKFHPNNRGFDDFFGFLTGGHTYHPKEFKAKYAAAIAAGSKPWHYLNPLENNGKEVEVDEYLTDELSHQGASFIQDAGKTEAPFFLFLSYNAPHTPLEAKEEDMAKLASITPTNITDEKRRTYAAMVYAMDRGIGEVVDALNESGQHDNTLIIFLSDNGGRTDQGASNAPLRGRKGDTWEGGYRVPMFFHWPGVVPAGNHCDHIVTALDFYPTLAGLGKATVPAGKLLSGKDIWTDFIAGKNPREGEMIFSLRHYPDYSNVGARMDQWKIWRSGGNKPWSLYNLDDDIGETHDVSAAHPEIVKEMVAGAQRWSRTHTPPQWFDNENFRSEWTRNGMPHYDETFECPENKLSLD